MHRIVATVQQGTPGTEVRTLYVSPTPKPRCHRAKNLSNSGALIGWIRRKETCDMPRMNEKGSGRRGKVCHGGK